MQRILLLGPGGAGKSTLARRLGDRLGLPVVHLDREHWQPGWVEPDPAWWASRLAELAAAERWVMDGNYGRHLASRLARADTVLLLLPPTTTCLRRVVGRWLAHRGGTRPDMAPGCPEQVTFEFLHWIATFRFHSLPRLERQLAALPPTVAVHVLRSTRDVERFMATLPSSRPAGAVAMS